ncbi:MAG: putative nicotinamide N-methyase [Candidatus Azotimanducaceae bacterium]|jgi:predicted nicotinamide N-methyase
MKEMKSQRLLNQLQAKLQQTISSARLEARSLPLCPQVQLFLLSDDLPRGPLPHDEMLAVLNEPAYWAFCWASGQVLARYLLNDPEICRNKTVLDFGAGSGVVGIAAALSGASRVICCDIDPTALLASEANAALNEIEVELLEDINDLQGDIDLLIAADVLYDRENFPWIKRLPNLSDQVLIADSRVKSDKLAGYTIVDRVEATTIPDLDEFKEFSDVRIYRN